jgi:hypothetical protein
MDKSSLDAIKAQMAETKQIQEQTLSRLNEIMRQCG